MHGRTHADLQRHMKIAFREKGRDEFKAKYGVNHHEGLLLWPICRTASNRQNHQTWHNTIGVSRREQGLAKLYIRNLRYGSVSRNISCSALTRFHGRPGVSCLTPHCGCLACF